jgi:hypothetical protein
VRVTSLEAITRALNDRGVPFLVVGGLAVNAHGYGRMTHDVDLVIKLTDAHVRGAFAALAGLGYRPRVPVTAEGFADSAQRARWIADKGMMVLNFHSDDHHETPVDLFVREPFDFDEEYEHALMEQLAPDVPVRILRLKALLRLKRDAARPQDLADVAELELLHDEGHDE